MGLNEKFQKIKEQIKQKDKKVFEIATVIFLLGVLILIFSKDFFATSAGKPLSNNDSNDLQISKDSLLNVNLEEKLSEILSKIKGAGRVKVMITYESGNERIYAYETRSNESQSKNDESMASDVETKIAYEEEDNGVKRPVLKKELNPLPKGAIVIADGANDERVRKNLSDAVSVLLKLSSYKIQVFEFEKNR